MGHFAMAVNRWAWIKRSCVWC